MLQFGVYLNNNTVARMKMKTLKAQSMETIYRNYKKYSESKEFFTLVQTKDSFGFVAYGNNTGEVLLLGREKVIL